jgi:RimJ/RimL family protein N-acetyltransferase
LSSAEVGFLFAPAAQGRGYGYESLRALCDYAFTTGGVSGGGRRRW